MEVVITVEQENALRAIGGLPPLQEPLQERPQDPSQERLEEPLKERPQEPLQERLEEPLQECSQEPSQGPLQEPSDMGHELDGPLHSPSGSSSQPLDFMGAELPEGQPGSWDGFLSDVDQEETQDNCTPAGSSAPNFIRPGEQNFIKPQDDTHEAMPDDENHPNNAVEYFQSSEDEQLLEEHGPTL